MNRIKFFIALIGLIYTVSVTAQSDLTIEATQFYTSFKYQNSAGLKVNSDYQGIYTGAYRVGYRYNFDKGIMLRGGIGMRKCGANYVYDDMNYSWRLQYADANIGVGYLYRLKRFSPYVMANGYFAYMLTGNQMLNNEDFNITKSELLNPLDYGLMFTPGVNIKLSEYISSYMEFNYLWGLQNIEKETSQKSSNYGLGLTLGLSFAIKELK